MYGYIYKTTNLINNKFYIGQHKHKTFDVNYFGSGNIITKAIKKYGKSNFKCEIIEKCNNKTNLNNKEIYWINKLNPDYNISTGGTGGNLGNEVNKRISNTLKDHWKTGKVYHHITSGFKKGYIPWNKGLKGTFLGRHHTEETRKKISKKNKGRIISLKQRLEHSLRMKGHKCSEETREKMRLHNSMHNPIYVEKARISRLRNLKKKRWITNGMEDRLIKLDSIDKYVHAGWRIGRVNTRGKQNKLKNY